MAKSKSKSKQKIKSLAVESTTLTPEQLSALGDNFDDLAKAVGNYRIDNRASLSEEQNSTMKDALWSLITFADNLHYKAAIVIMNDVEDSLAEINDITMQINKSYQNLQKIQKAIDVATAGVALGSALFSKDPQAIFDAITGLKTTWAA